jgi:hypothetical protein
MATETLVKKLNKEIKTLEKEVGRIKSVLISVMSIPEERLGDYKNTQTIRKAYLKAAKTHEPS